MESTGDYWKPIYNLLEPQNLQPMVVNAQHIKAVPGRKTDVKNAEWSAFTTSWSGARKFYPEPGAKRIARESSATGEASLKNERGK